MWNYKKKAQYIEVTHTYSRGPRKGQTITVQKRVLKKRSPRKIIEEKLDDIVREITRKRDNNTCVKCHKECYGSNSTPSHFFNRWKKSTKWNLLNVDTLDLGCHRKVENKKTGWYRRFKIKQLGIDQFTILESLANSPGHYTLDQLQELYVQLSAQKDLL